MSKRTECICGTTQLVCPEDPEMNDCGFCTELDPYDPCPVYGYGCGAMCGCCTPEQQKAVTIGGGYLLP